MLCVGVLKAAPAANALMAAQHTCTKTESATAAVISYSPDPLPLHYFLPVWMSSAECVSGLQGPSSWAEQLSCVTFSPLLCISGSLLYFGLACLQGSLIFPSPPQSMWPLCATHSVNSLTPQGTSNSLPLPLSPPTLPLRAA